MNIPRVSILAILVLSVAGTSALGQGQVSVPVVNQSAPGSPLAFSGAVSFLETVTGESLRYSFGESITARNISTQSIVAVKWSVRSLSPHARSGSHVVQIDRFFADPIAPGESVPISFPLGDHVTVIPLRGKGTPRTVQPRALVELLYAQFEDGSVFGSQVEGDEILALRRTLWDTLRELDQTYQSRGPDKFVEGLKKPIVPHSALHTVLQELLAAADEHGPAQAEEKVQEMLTDAEEHQNAMSGGR